jgi:hypothetical protein
MIRAVTICILLGSLFSGCGKKNSGANAKDLPAPKAIEPTNSKYADPMSMTNKK